MIKINDNISIKEDEIEFHAIRSGGKGGQNVNKVSTAIHLRFDIAKSSLPVWVKERLLHSGDNRITNDGVLIIKAQNERSQERNREAAISRLVDFILKATIIVAPRRSTKPTRGSITSRLNNKSHRGELKKTRSKVNPNDI